MEKKKYKNKYEEFKEKRSMLTKKNREFHALQEEIFKVDFFSRIETTINGLMVENIKKLEKNGFDTKEKIINLLVEMIEEEYKNAKRFYGEK